MWAMAVGVVSPVGDACVAEAEQQCFIEELVPHPAVKALAEPVLYWFALRDEVPVDDMVLRPGQRGVRRDLSVFRYSLSFPIAG